MNNTQALRCKSLTQRDLVNEREAQTMGLGSILFSTFFIPGDTAKGNAMGNRDEIRFTDGDVSLQRHKEE
jgi:hypothetical protein